MKHVALIPFSALLISAAPSASHWTLKEKADAITNAKSIALTLEQEPILMRLECSKGDPEPFSVLVGTMEYIGGRPTSRNAITRFDTSPPKQALWGFSDYFALLLSGQREFIASVARANKVAIRVTDRRGAPVDMVFDVAGAALQVGKFLSSCKSIGIN